MITSTHDDFFGEVVDYVNGDWVTHIERKVLPEQQPITPPTGATVHASIEAMLEAELKKRGEEATLKDVSYAHIPRANFTGTVEDTTTNKTYSVANHYFHHSSLEGQYYTGTDDQVHQVFNAITSSWDRSSKGLHMARVVVDPDTSESICYGGRPDTLERAKTQAADIFRTECESKRYKGIVKDPKTDEYTLTYVVDSLTNPGKLQNPELVDERQSLIDEINVLRKLKNETLIIDGKTVHLKPIHVHHTLSVFGELSKAMSDDFGGTTLERTINAGGYKELIAYAKKIANQKSTKSETKKLIEDTLFFLEKRNSLSVSERLILTDFLVQLCKLPIVHHCKSIVDRTSVASSVSMMNHFIKRGRLIHTLPKDGNRIAIHHLLKNEEYKKRFISFMNINHQVSLDARVGILPQKEGVDLKERLVGRAALGLNLKSGILAASGTLSFFPNDDLKPSWLHKDNTKRRFFTFYVALPALIIIGYVFSPFIALGLLYKGKSNYIPIWLSLPFRIKWRKLSLLNFNFTFNLQKNDFNGEARHLLPDADHIRDETEEDPRLDLIPEYLK